MNHFDPLYNFYHRDEQGSELKTEFRTTEATVGLRYGKDETFIINDNDRISLGPSNWPIFERNYSRGLKWLEGEYNYSKLKFYIYQKLNLGMLGISRYEAEAGKVFGEVPYPVLENHLGNETFFYTTAAFNTMNFNEFASDQYFSIRYRHFFEGFLLNKVPLIRKLKWRAVANANMLFGSVSDANKSHAPGTDPEGYPLQAF